MLKHTTSVMVLAGLFVAGASMAQAAPKYTFALVPKNTNNPFFDQARDGCKKAEKELNGQIECFYTGPGEHGGGDEQVQVVEDLIAKGVDGIGVSAANAAAMAHALEDAKKAGIPVLTWDSDLLPENADLRVAYIGTHNYDIGVNLAKIAMKVKPNGGTVCIQSGGAAAANHNERMQGIRDTLGGMTGTTSPGERLTGQNGWTEVDGCPLYTNDDFPLAMQQEQDILNKYPDLGAFIPTGGFGEFLVDAYKNSMEKYKADIASGKIAIAVADTLPMQIDELKAGLASGNVGQRPFEMGYKVMYGLLDIKEGKAPPADPTYTGLDICTPDNVDTCVGGGG
jgi:ribose transport system substrate-binding protein